MPSYEKWEARKAAGVQPWDDPDRQQGPFRIALFISALSLLVGAMVSVNWLIDNAPAAYAQKTPLAYLLAILLTIVLGTIVYLLRNVRRRWYEYPPIELGVSIALAGAALKQGTNPVLTFVALLASARVAADSIKNFYEFRKAALERSREPKAE